MNDLDFVRSLGRVLTIQQPLGPPDAAQITRNPDLLRLLYDPTNRIHRQAETTGAPYVIGRKGAGKTAFVTAPKRAPDVVAVELPSADVYQGAFGVVERLLERRVQIFPEHTARLWSHLIWSAVLAEVVRNGIAPDSPSLQTTRAFVEALGGGTVPRTADAAVSAYLRRVVASIEEVDHIGGVGALLDAVEGAGIAVTDAIDAGSHAIADSARRYVVIVDSLEHYIGDLPTRNFQQRERIAFEGLFRFIGSEGTRPDRAFDIRFAFPAELWNVLQGVSANPIKDFHRRVIAQWSARELVQLVGNRLAIFCSLHVPEIVEATGSVLDGKDPLSYDAARAVIEAVLPLRLVNALGQPEDTVGYLLRHTQLLPRHLITIMNRIWEVRMNHDPGAPLPVDPAAVLEGVRHAEAEIVDDIIASFSRVHPTARLCCERVLPNLAMTFTSGELHRAYNHNGVRRDTGLEFREFERTLVEIGCVGRVIEARSTSRYVVGEFEYTRPAGLPVGAEEELCLHPVFAEAFSCRHSTSRLRQLEGDERSYARAVYPVGSDPGELRDYRDDA